MSPNRRILLNIIATYGRSLYALAVGLLTARWALQALGEVDYGLMGVVGGLTTFISFFNGILAGSIGRFYAFSVGAAARVENTQTGMDECRKWFTVATSIHTVMPVLLMCVGYPIGHWAVCNYLTIPPERVHDCVWVFRFVCVTCFVSMVSVPLNAMYTAKQYIAELTIYSYVTTTVNALLLYYMITHPSVWLVRYAFYTCLVGLIPSVLIACRAVVLFKECRIVPKYLFSPQDIRRLASFAGWNFFGAMGNLLKGAGMNVLVNKMLGPSRNAASAIASAVAGHTQTLSASMTGAFSPAITNAVGSGDMVRVISLVHKTCKFGAVMILPFAIPAALEIDEILLLWLRNPPEGVARLCIWTMAVLVLENMTAGLWIAISANGRIRLYQLIVGSCFMLTLPIAWLMMKWGFGIYSVGYSLFITLAIVAAVRVMAVRMLLGINPGYWVKRILVPVSVAALVSSVFGCLPKAFMMPSLLRLSITAVLSEVVLWFLILFYVLDPEERKFFRSRIMSMLSKFGPGNKRLAERGGCAGCGACAAACPCLAIRFQPDAEGFCFPDVDECKCNGCGACVRACPLSRKRERDDSPKCYAARSRNPILVAGSSSGGVFSELAIKTIARGGVVFGAAYNEDDLTVRHVFVESVDELFRLRGSKYVQSAIGDTYKDARRFLAAQRPVLFSGTPCQIAGLLSYLHSPSEHLLTVEVICHGVPPPKLFERLKDDLKLAHGMALSAISFRDKSEGWTSRAITGWYDNGRKIREHGPLNSYFKAFIGHLSLRKSCERCEFIDGKSGADITLGDFWGVNHVIPELDDDRGVSAVIAHSAKGVTSFEETDCHRYNVSIADIARYNPSYRAKRLPARLRNKFMKSVYDIGLAAATEKYLVNSCDPLILRACRYVHRVFFHR